MKKLLIIVLSIQTVYYGTAQKVGIGTTTPAFKLDVKGGSINTDSLYRIGGNTVLSVKGEGNTFTGIGSGLSNTTGLDNTANGYQTLNSNTTGFRNSANGYRALSSNTTGGSNTANGFVALLSNTIGGLNTANGYAALLYNIYGNENTAVGSNALSNTFGSNGNTALGANAGDSHDNGYYNTFLGSDADANGSGYFNSIAIGNTSRVTAPLQVRIGGSFIESIGGYRNWTNISDGRYKKNIKEDVRGLDFIMKLRPVTYNLDVAGISQKLNESRGKENDPQFSKSISAKEKTVFSGFVAQEVEAVANAIGYDFSGVDKPKNVNDFYGLRYAEFVVPLVKAVQEQQGLIRDMQKQIDQLIFLQKK